MGKTPYPLYRRLAGWAPGPVWTGAENLASKLLVMTSEHTNLMKLFRKQSALVGFCDDVGELVSSVDGISSVDMYKENPRSLWVFAEI
jgi:hypothetical protein